MWVKPPFSPERQNLESFKTSLFKNLKGKPGEALEATSLFFCQVSHAHPLHWADSALFADLSLSSDFPP